MKTQHTPGPWVVVTSWEDYMVVGPYEEEIIFQSGPYGTPTVYHANARLIAAAPELLEALEWAFNRLSNLNIPEHGGSSDGFGWDIEGNKLKIENIIKKARGDL